MIGVTSPVWLPLTLIPFFLALPVIGVFFVKEKIQENQKSKAFAKDKSAYMSEKSEEFRIRLSSEKELREIVKQHLVVVQRYLQDIKIKIPAIIEADKMLLSQLRGEADERREAADYYLPINASVMNLRGEWAMFTYLEARPPDIDSADLSWEQNADSCIGKGAFATVFKGTLHNRSDGHSVALKDFKEELNVTNATRFRVEETILRKGSV